MLIGNHEQMFLDWYCNEQEFLWLSQDQQLVTTKSFFKAEQWDYVFRELLHLKRSKVRMSSFIKAEIKKNIRNYCNGSFLKGKNSIMKRKPKSMYMPEYMRPNQNYGSMQQSHTNLYGNTRRKQVRFIKTSLRGTSPQLRFPMITVI